MKYKIYHIPNIKIGVSTNPKRRVENQGYTEYEILESYDCIDTVSEREMQLQKQYGYKIDCTLYKQSHDWVTSGIENAKGKGAKTQIENKIGMFGFSKDKRQKLNKSIAKKGGNVTKEKYSKAVNVYDYYTNELVNQFSSIKDATNYYNATNLKQTLYGTRNHSKGLYLKLQNG